MNKKQKNILNIFLILLFSCNAPKNDKIVNDTEVILTHTDSSFNNQPTSTSIELQESIKCDIKTLLWIDSLMNERVLNEKDIYILFKSTNPFCLNNAEYSQMVNEYLWKALINNPEKFAWSLGLKTIHKDQKDYIISQIESPINDSFKGSNLINKIESSDLIYRDSLIVKRLIKSIASD